MVFVHEHMSKQTKRAKIPLKELPFMSSALPKLFNSGSLETTTHINEVDMALYDSTNCDNALNIHTNKLDSILKAWNFKCVPACIR